MFEAVSGSISPALLAPSVISTMTFDLARDGFRRASALPSPMPMAVPSPCSPSFCASSRSSTMARSVVSGATVRERPANVSIPTRSPLRPSMKARVASLAT